MVHINPYILCFSGRKSSGKTTLVQVCQMYGYQELNFADALKELVCDMLNLSLTELNKQKDLIQSITLTPDQWDPVLSELDTTFQVLKPFIRFEFTSIRHLLQYLGTEVIRTLQTGWHIQKTLSKIQPGNYYVIGDCRFPDELQAMKQLGAECWFLFRPSFRDNVSNHDSETALQWFDFPIHRHYINDGTVKQLCTAWCRYLCFKIPPKMNHPISFLYLHSSDGYPLNVSNIENPYMLENLKLWNPTTGTIGTRIVKPEWKFRQAQSEQGTKYLLHSTGAPDVGSVPNQDKVG